MAVPISGLCFITPFANLSVLTLLPYFSVGESGGDTTDLPGAAGLPLGMGHVHSTASVARLHVPGVQKGTLALVCWSRPFAHRPTIERFSGSASRIAVFFVKGCC